MEGGSFDRITYKIWNLRRKQSHCRNLEICREREKNYECERKDRIDNTYEMDSPDLDLNNNFSDFRQ